MERLETLEAHLCINALRPDEEGYLYATDVALADRDFIARAVVETGHSYIRAGLCLLRDGRVWNDQEHPRFDPAHLRQSFDRMSFLVSFIEAVAQFIEEGDDLAATISGFDEIQLSPVSKSVIRLSGGSGGNRSYGEVRVGKRAFLEAARSVACDALRLIDDVGKRIQSLGGALEDYRHDNDRDGWEKARSRIDRLLEDI